MRGCGVEKYLNSDLLVLSCLLGDLEDLNLDLANTAQGLGLSSWRVRAATETVATAGDCQSQEISLGGSVLVERYALITTVVSLPGKSVVAALLPGTA